MDSLVFYMLLFVHLVSLIVGFGAVVVIDVFGLLWLAKKAELPFVVRIAEVTQRMIWIGLGGLVLSGVPMLLIKGYLDNLTMLKVFAVFMLAVNGIFLHFIKKGMHASTGKIGPTLKFRIALSSFVSQLGWWSAIVIGFLHRHWRHEIQWPSQPLLVMLVVTVLILLIAFIGERKLRNS